MIRILLLDDRVLVSRRAQPAACRGAGPPDRGAVFVRRGSSRGPENGAAPDLILLDYDLGEQNGFAFLQRARAGGYTGKVLMVTAGMSPGETVRALDSGACGLFLKHAPPNDLLRAIHAAMRGEALLSASALAGLLDAARQEEARRPPALQLSDRERAVLLGIFAGLANKEIAAELGISEGYVKAVLQQLFAKTGVRTRAQLVRIALEHHFAGPSRDEPGS